MRSLYERGYERRDILELFRFIDWLLQLPKALEQKLQDTIVAFEEEHKRYVTNIERISIEKGMQQGMQKGLQQSIVEALRARFGEPPSLLVAQMEALHDEETLRALLQRAVTAETLAEVEQMASQVAEGSADYEAHDVEA